MKRIFLLISVLTVLLFNSCTIGGMIEAEQLDGTWVSENTYASSSSSYYVYYDFDPTSIEIGGDQSGIYSIRSYQDSFWFGAIPTDYSTLETGTYTTDYLLGKMTLSSGSSSRILDYTVTDNYLTFTDSNWWSSSSITLRKYN